MVNSYVLPLAIGAFFFKELVIMNAHQKYLKEELNQACCTVKCLYSFFIENAIATDDYHRIHAAFKGGWVSSFASFPYSYRFVTITQCARSYKVRIALTENNLIKYDSYKLLSKYVK